MLRKQIPSCLGLLTQESLFYRSPVIWMATGNFSGSRNSDGNVPNVNWYDDKLKVNWINPDNSNSNWRSREVVSEEDPDNFGVIFFCVLLKIFNPTIGHFRDFLQARFKV